MGTALIGSKLLSKSGRSSIFGSGSEAGWLGTGQYRAEKYEPEKEAFTKKLAGKGQQEQVRQEQEALRSRQLNQTGRLEAQATGKAPSIADAQLKSATNRSLAQQIAASKAQRGGSAAARERMLAKGQMEAGRNIAEQSAIQKLQEQQAAEQALMAQTSGVQAALQAQRAQDVQLAEADRASRQALEEMRLRSSLGAQGLNLQGYQGASQARGNLIGGLGSAIAMASDKNCKKNIKKENPNSIIRKGKISNIVTKSSSDEECKKNKIKEGLIKSKGRSFHREEERKKSEASDRKFLSDWKKGKKAQDEEYARRKKKEAKGSSMEGHFSRAKKAGMSKKAAIKLWNKKQASKGIEGAKKRRAEKESEPKKRSFLRKALGMKPENSDDKKSKAISAFKNSMQSKGVSDYGSRLAERMASSSDEECKQNVQKEDFNPKSFLDKLQAYSYEYKNSHKDSALGGKGRFLSVMAQDLEKAGPVGKSMVKDSPMGKYVDYGKGFGAILAAQAHLNQRLAEIEKKKK